MWYIKRMKKETRGRPKGSLKKDAKRFVVRIRCTAREYHRIRFLANEYAGGNVNKWLTYAALEAPRRKLK